MIQITEYWEKVDRSDEGKLGYVRKGDYEVKSRYVINNTLDDLKDRYRGRHRFTITKDKIIEDCGRAWGIHSYKEIITI